jgi:hypothetical protein
MGIYKAKPYYQGGWVKCGKINNSRTIGQSSLKRKPNFKILL